MRSMTEQLTINISGPPLDDNATDDQLRAKYVALRLAADMSQKKHDLYAEHIHRGAYPYHSARPATVIRSLYGDHTVTLDDSTL